MPTEKVIESILAYGFDLGGPGHRWAVKERGPEHSLTAPWFEGTVSFPVKVETELVGKVPCPPLTTLPPHGYYGYEATALRLIGVAAVPYATKKAPCFILAAAVLRVGQSNMAADAGIVLSASPQQLAEWDGKLSVALEALGLTPFQRRAAWLLCSYYNANT